VVRLRVLVVWGIAGCGRLGFDVPGQDEFLDCDEPFGVAAQVTQPMNGLTAPTITLDGLELFANGQGGELFVMNRASFDAPWGPAMRVTGPWTDMGADASPASLSGDGLELFYTSHRTGHAWIYSSRRATRSSPWVDEQQVAAVTGDCDIASDGLSIYAQDYNTPIMVATRTSTTQPFSNAHSVGPPIDDGSTNESPSISFDGRELWFQSNRSGTNRVHVARRSAPAGPFESVVDAGLPAGSATPEISPNGRDLYFGSSMNEGSLFVTTRCN